MTSQTPISADSSVLLLRELKIPGRTGPTPSGAWGINLAAAQDNFPRHGLQCQAGPWGNMGVGDKLVIFWGDGNQVLQETVDQAEKDTELTLFIPAARIANGAVNVSYRVTRLGGTPEPSEVMPVFVKLTRPGGQDQNGDTPGHSELHMTLPKEILDGGIDKDNVAAGVPITILAYPQMAVGDVIQVTWGGRFVLSEPLTQDQVDGKVPIVVQIDEATIRAAGDSDSSGLAVAFEVYDVVDNRSEDWCAEQRVVVGVDQTRLTAPIVKEAVNNELDVDKLGDKEATVQILAVDNNFKLGDIIVLRVKGTPVEGAPVDLEITGEPLSNVPSIPELKVPNAALKQLAKTQMVFSYRLKKADGSADLLSKGRFIRVIGEIQRLKAPIAEDAQQGAIDPELPRTRIEIPFDKSFAAGQALKLFWLGTRPDFSTYLPDLGLRPITNGDIEAGESLYITVAGEHLTPIKGGTLELYYQLLIDDAARGTLNKVNATHAIRESLHLAPLNVGEPRLELPEPKVAGVVDGVLDPDRSGTTLTVEYLQTVKDDEVTYEWVGSKTGKASDSVKLSSFTAGQPVPFSIKAELIKGNEGGTVSASYLINRAAGGTSYSNALEFSVGVALDLTPPSIKEAPNDTRLDPMAALTSLTAQVNYVGMQIGDKISVTWKGAAGTPTGGSHATEPRSVATVGVQEIPLLVSVLAFNLGKSVEVSYTVTRGTNQPLPSGVRTLAVGRLPDSALRAPTILEAANNGEGPEFDVTSLTQDAVIRILNWPLIALGQYVWLRLQGTKADNTAWSKTVFQPPGAQTNPTWIATGRYDHATNKAELQGLKDGSSLTLEFKAALGGSQVEAEAVTFPVRTYIVKALVALKPVITSVKDSKGVEIPNGGYTADTTVVLSGTASKDQQVEIFDGTASKGTAIVDASGNWTHTVTGLALTSHSFTAKAKYGNEEESTARTLTVVALVTPAITSVRDSKGVEIPNGGYTVDTTVVLSGTASKGQQVEIFDVTVSKGTAPVDGNGNWSKTVTGLALAAHSFTAKAKYGSGQTSAAWTLTVAAAVTPAISSVKDGDGYEIVRRHFDAFTAHSNVTLSGRATANLQVEIFDGTTLKGTSTANTSGIWTHTVSGLSVGRHIFTAKAVYGNRPTSPAFVLTKLAGTEPLYLYMNEAVKQVYPELLHGARGLTFVFVPQADGSTGIRNPYDGTALHMSETAVWCAPPSGNAYTSFTILTRPNGSIVIQNSYNKRVLGMTYATVRAEVFDPNDANTWQRFKQEYADSNMRIRLFHR